MGTQKEVVGEAEMQKRMMEFAAKMASGGAAGNGKAPPAAIADTPAATAAEPASKRPRRGKK